MPETKIARALENVNVSEFLDGFASDGAINISNLITIKGQYVPEIKVTITSDGISITVGNDLVYEF